MRLAPSCAVLGNICRAGHMHMVTCPPAAKTGFCLSRIPEKTSPIHSHGWGSPDPLRLALVCQLMPVLETLREPGVVSFVVRIVVASAVCRRAAARPPAKAPGNPARLPATDAPDRAPAPHRPVRSAGRSRLAAQPPPSRSSGPYAPAARPGAPPPASSPDHTGSLPSVQPAVRIQMPLIPTPDRRARRPAASPLNGLCRQAHSPAGKPCAPARRPAPRLARHPSEAARPKATDRPAGPA